MSAEEAEIVVGPSDSSITSNTSTETSNILTSIPSNSKTRFPIIENPLRVTLHCNGYYLWGCKRRGKIITRRKRNDKDEFRLEYDDTGSVMIRHHKFGGVLTLRKEMMNASEASNLETDPSQCFVSCVKTDEEEEDLILDDNSMVPKEDGEDDDGDSLQEDILSSPNQNYQDIKEDDKKWCFIKGVSDSLDNQRVLLKSLSAGYNLGINNEGKIIFANDQDHDCPPSFTLWTIECVTGELCFMSNPCLDLRIRCDMTGILATTPSMKGWELFRFMEAGNGYVKISSWMHSQWLLYSTKDGSVGTCSHAESFLDYRKENLDDNKDTQEEENILGSEYRCCKWAIEKSPDEDGVVIRSKTFGRLLSIRNNRELRTYLSGEENQCKDELDSTKKIVTKRPSTPKDWKSLRASMSKSWDGAKKNIQSKTQAMQSKMKDGGQNFVEEKDTIVWQLEAGHSQSYFFLSINLQDSEESKPKSIGPFPQVTTNLRKNTKVQLLRFDDNITKLCVAKNSSKQTKVQYISCASDGCISLLDDIHDASTEWIMDRSKDEEGGTTFKSKLHNKYLSYRPKVVDSDHNVSTKTTEKLKNLIKKEKDTEEELYGSSTLSKQEIWKLDPCMPRAVSSDKIKTFALGTSIAVGTTVAMPFALAGVGALMGAVGAEVGTFTTLVFAGLTSMEAIASVGAIGATAYIVFKPAENSLTDEDDKSSQNEEELAFSKRPFSDWRNW